jgi:WD40 repeat protein
MEHRDCKKKCAGLNLRLTGKDNPHENLTFGTYVAISNHRSLVWFVLASSGLNLPPNADAAILYRNVDGALVPAIRIPPDPKFPFPSTGSASHDFSYLTIVDENGLGATQIRVFSAPDLLAGNLTPKLIIPQSEDIVPTFIIQGKFILGNGLSTLTYVPAAPLPIPDANSTLRILDLNTGETLVLMPLTGYSNDGGYLFYHKEKLYLVVGTTGQSIRVGGGGSSMNPVYLNIYRFNGSVLTQIIKQPVPKIINAIDIPVKSDDPCITLIAIGMGRATPPGVIDLHDTPGTNFTGETSGARVYQFDGKHLCIAASVTPGDAVGSVSFSPTARYLATIFHTSSADPAVNDLDELLVYRLEPGSDPQLESIHTSPKCCQTFCMKLAAQAPVPSFGFYSQFSSNGKWFVSQGNYLATGTIADVALFRVDQD